MNMILMLGIVTFFYFFSLTLMCFYIEKMNPKFWNVVFVVSNCLFFLCWNLAAYERGWLNNRFMTLDNISPMMCTAISFLFVMNERVRAYCKCAIAFLSFGMFCAMLISPERAYLFSFDEQADFLYASEALCHMIMALFGMYLILSKQVEINMKDLLKSMTFVYSVVGFGVALNYIFHKDFFGMAPYGDYAIYGMRLFGSFETTLIGYCLGILVVLVFGLQAGWALKRLMKHKYEKIGESLSEQTKALEPANLETENVAETAIADESETE